MAVILAHSILSNLSPCPCIWAVDGS